MAKQFYQLVGGTELVSWDDPANLSDEASVQSLIDGLKPFQDLPDASRALLAYTGLPQLGIAGGWPDLASFDDVLDDEVDRLEDLRDYFSYDSKQETIGNVRDGAWFEPEAVEAFSAEQVGNEAALAIDGDNSTGWIGGAGAQSITFRLRSYRKNVESVRLWIPNNTLKAELQGLTIRAAEALSQIDNPSNVMNATPFDLTFSGSAWQTVPFDRKKRCRYIKLDIAGSTHASNESMVRAIEARVVTFNHEK